MINMKHDYGFLYDYGFLMDSYKNNLTFTYFEGNKNYDLDITLVKSFNNLSALTEETWKLLDYLLYYFDWIEIHNEKTLGNPYWDIQIDRNTSEIIFEFNITNIIHESFYYDYDEELSEDVHGLLKGYL